MAFVGLDRGIVDHWIYQDAEYFKVWFEMLYRARYSIESEKKLIDNVLVEMNYGEFVYGRIKWSERLKVSERRLRTLIDKLTKDGMIEVVSNYPRFTVYRILNYAKYNQQNDQQESQAGQGESNNSDQHSDHRATNRRPADDQRATTKEQGINKVNKGNKVKQEIKDSPQFVEFWNMYPRRIGNADAFNAWNNAIKRGAEPSEIYKAVENYKINIQQLGTEMNFVKHPSSFLNKDRWKDYLKLTVLIGGGNGGKHGRSFANNAGTYKPDEDELNELYYGSPKPGA